MNLKKSIFILSIFLMAGSVHAELASTISDKQVKSDIRDCSSYRNFILEPVGRECVVRNESGSVKGVYKRVTLSLKSGERVRGTEIVGTGLVFEDAIRSSLCQTDKVTNDSGEVLILNKCFDSEGNSFGAEQYCEARGLKLPSGYPRSENGKYGFPDHDSDLVLADSLGFTEVFRDMSGEWDKKDKFFLSSSVHPGSSLLAYNFSKNLGTTFFYRDFRTSRYSARCVGSVEIE